MEYTYLNIMNKPDLSTLNDSGELISGISYDILNSEMIDKELQWCFWDGDSQQLVISFLNPLHFSDKIILNSIITNYQ